MSTHDTDGRAWAKLSDLKAGDSVEDDGGFGCLRPNTRHVVHESHLGLYVVCDEGHHYFAGSSHDGEHAIGFYAAGDAA